MIARTFWLWPALLTLALGAYHGGRPQLWRDELVTWEITRRSNAQIFDVLHHLDAVIGSYYFLLHGWIQLFGDSDAALRLPSALAMSGAAAFVALTARRLFGVRTALVAGVLFAFTPEVSRYAQEARGYAFVVLAVSAATLLLLRALERPTPLRWLVYALTIPLAGVFHLVALVFLAPHAVVVALRWWRSRDRRLLLFVPASVLGLLPLVPLALVGRRQVGRQLGWLISPTLQQVADSFWRSLFGSAWYSLGILALAVLPLAWSRGRRPAVELGICAVLPIVLLWGVSQGSTSYFLDRYLLFTLPAWAVLAAAGLTALRPRAFGAFVLVALILLAVPDQQNFRRGDSREVWNARAAAAVVERGYRPGDGVLPVRGDNWYLLVPQALAHYLPAADRLKDVSVARSAVDAKNLYPPACTDLRACIGDTQRLWVVTAGSDDPYFGFEPEDVRTLGSIFPRHTTTHIRGAVVTLLERGPGQP